MDMRAGLRHETLLDENQKMTKVFRLRIVSKITALIVCLTCLLIIPAAAQDEPVGRSGPIVTSGEASIGGAFELIDQNGETVTHEDLKGKPHILYFGFAFCPDVCPFELQRLGAALAKADPDGSFFRPVFITIDPERDTVKQLSAYVTSNGFPKGLIGLTGSMAQINRAKGAYKVYSQKVPDPVSAASYTFNHSNLIYLMDSEGGFVEFFSDQQSVDYLAQRLSKYKGAPGRTKKLILVATVIFLSVVFILIGRMGKNALKQPENS